MILVKDSLLSRLVPEIIPHTNPVADDIFTEVQSIRIQRYQLPPLTIHNVYRPPHATKFHPSCLPTSADSIVAGDFNCHHPSWDSFAKTDALGSVVHEWMESHGMVVWNSPDQPTRASKTTLSSPDLVISTDTWDTSSWTTLDSWGSDHIAYSFDIPGSWEKVKPLRTPKRWNWKLANWAKYAVMMDNRAAVILQMTDVHQAYSALVKALQQCAATCIPKISSGGTFKPWWSEEVVCILKRRNAERRLVVVRVKSGVEADDAALQLLERQASDMVRAAKETAWETFLHKCNRHTHLSALFKELAVLDGNPSSASFSPLHQGSSTCISAIERATCLVNHFATVCSPCNLPVPEFLPSNTTQLSPNHAANAPFTHAEFDLILQELVPQKSPGLDGIMNEMLTNLGPYAQEALLHVINLSWASGEIPEDWRAARIIPLHKPRKDKCNPDSYRPIWLTVAICKFIERLIGTRLLYLLDRPGSGVEGLHKFQAGGRKGRSTDEQLVYITQSMNDLRRDGHPACVALFDFRKAFDCVPRHLLLYRLRSKGFPEHWITWFTAYLSGRTASVHLDGADSPFAPMTTGVPQGSVLAPTFFLVYLDGLLRDLVAAGYQAALYADDIAVLISGNSRAETERKTQLAMSIVQNWCCRWGMVLALDKTCVLPIPTLLDAIHNNPPFTPTLTFLDGSPVKIVNEARYLGILLDSANSMKPQAAAVTLKFQRRLNLLKKCLGSTCAMSTRNLRTLYTTYVLPSVCYGLGAFGPLLSPPNLATLSALHRQAAALITGITTPSASHIAVLYEANLRPFADIVNHTAAKLYNKFVRQPGTNGWKICISDRVRETGWRECARDTLARSLKMYPPPALVGPLPFDAVNWDSRFPRSDSDTRWLHDIRPAPIFAQFKQEGFPYVIVPPWEQPLHVTIVPTIPGLTRALPKPVQRQKAESLIAAVPNLDYEIYSDGSVVDGCRGGAGVYVATTNVFLSAAAGAFATSYQTEMVAIYTALRYMRTVDATHKSIAIFTDSKSALQALQRGPQRQREHVSCCVWGLLHQLTSQNHHSILLQYIPAHVGIKGNERADVLAKAGAELSQLNIPVAVGPVAVQLKAYFKNKHREKLHSEYTFLWRHTKGGLPKAAPLTRAGEVVMAKLRNGQTPVLRPYLVFAGVEEAGSQFVCTSCRVPNTLSHMFTQCPDKVVLRRALLRNRPVASLLLDHPADTIRFLLATGELPHFVEAQLLCS